MRRARLTTTHDSAADAQRVATSLSPDNTPEVDTDVDGRQVVTTITRETTGGLHSTVDDYVVNCSVAAQLANRPADTHDTTHE